MKKKPKKRALEKGVIIVNSEGESPDLLEAAEQGGCRDISVVSRLSDATTILTSLSKDKTRKLISILAYPDFDDSLLERVKEYLEENRIDIHILLMFAEDPEEFHAELGGFKDSVMQDFIHQVDLSHYQSDRNYLPNPESQEKRKKADKIKLYRDFLAAALIDNDPDSEKRVHQEFMEPCTEIHSYPIGLFSSQPKPRIKIQQSSDWDVDRGLYQSSIRMGMDFEAHEREAALRVFKENNLTSFGQLVSCCMGPGDGTIMRELIKAKSPCQQAGIADAVYFSLERLFQNAVLFDYKNNADLQEFIKMISILIYDSDISDSPYGLYLDNPADEAAIRHTINHLDQTVQLKRYCDNPVICLPGVFDQEYKAHIPQPVIRLFKKYLKNPAAFLRKYFSAILSKTSSRPLIDLVDAYADDILCHDFRDLEAVLPDKMMFTTVHACRSLSHLGPGYYWRVINTMARRLMPGGFLVDDGFQESYSACDRFEEIQELSKAMNKNSYEFHFQPIWTSPASRRDSRQNIALVVSRGIRRKVAGQLDFYFLLPFREEQKARMHEKEFMINFSD